jgi:hypothetical protein
MDFNVAEMVPNGMETLSSGEEMGLFDLMGKNLGGIVAYC